MVFLLHYYIEMHGQQNIKKSEPLGSQHVEDLKKLNIRILTLRLLMSYIYMTLEAQGLMI